MGSRTIIHYAFTAAVLSLYGGRVCYLVDTLNILTWAKFIALVFTGAYFIRWLAWSRLVRRFGRDIRPMLAFLLEFGMSLAISAFITGYNMAMHGFGLQSGMKVMVGVIAFGFFIAVDSALGEERKLLRESAASGKELGAGNRLISLPLKFSLIGSTTIILVVVIAFLFFTRDLLLVGEGPYDDYDAVAARMSSGLIFLGVVILVEVLNMVISYSRNLKLQFQYHTGALLAAAEGDFGKRVPVATTDEFAVIARYTNLMISTLRSRTSEKQKAEDATKLKDQFVSLVAHDMRSPFNAILGFLKIAYRDNESPLAPRHKELVGKAITNGELLVKTIDHLLDITMLQTGKIPVEPRFMNIRVLVQEAIGQHSALAEKKGITFINTLPDQRKVYGDPVLAGEVFSNLFSNSVKFCKAGDAITVSALENDSATITVRDTGVGIPKLILPDIFRHEVRTTSAGTGGEKGTGLGLPFCADIMHALGGEITAESEQGWGTMFMVRFPIVEPVCLIAIQHPSTRQGVADALRQSGVRVIEAFTPEEAGRMAVEKQPHITVVDVDGENGAGIEILKKIRSDERMAKLRVLAIAPTDDIKVKTAILGLRVAGIADSGMGTDGILEKAHRLM